MATGDSVGDCELEHQHGKARVRVARVWHEGSSHVMVEWSVSVSLRSKTLAAYTEGDNSAIVATDTIKNTVYVLAKRCSETTSMEEFGTQLAELFLNTYSQVTGVRVNLTQRPWERVSLDNTPHEHGFKLGSENRTAQVLATKDGNHKVTAGISDLSLLKTTKSGFEGFVRDKNTLLPETRERMMASSIRSVWSYSKTPLDYNETHAKVKNILLSTFFGPSRGGVYSPSVQNTLYLMAKEVLLRVPEIESVYLNMPNIHFLPVNMPSIGIQFKDDVYLPTDEPHGSIEATLQRKNLPTSKL
ncbi:urate oxidase [Marchantia polymorpha subsp. ruderalis]|uniref:Uricase n=2 Tax=Marchantia polymorpha TaxID=3197 RepID=A0A176WE49_MARPO|nr:hypothetical protein AXG93_1842s1110 [Marchantia polymorpha subsp. ruderalis]PTQ34498.1 hypothetical protein MARPO_0079s0008 [Marchantia polymorpha]BBN20055.1 hypothetical protein Mp_8g16060 [Marchantia polymorpha subsp. ruderalis]|eukprot:PTQ34498.1 hypothetical protein MARPO_0079s0008 [Marchantia polymorpha]